MYAEKKWKSLVIQEKVVFVFSYNQIVHIQTIIISPWRKQGQGVHISTCLWVFTRRRLTYGVFFTQPFLEVPFFQKLVWLSEGD